MLSTGASATGDVPAPVEVAPAVGSAAPEGPGDSARVSARLATLKLLLDSESRRAAWWTWGWAGAYAAITVAQVVPIPFVDQDTRTDLWVGAASSVLGGVLQAVLPLRVASSEGLPDDPVAALAEAERRARVGAEDERLLAGWYAHVINIGVNAVIGLVLGLGYRHWLSAGVNFGVGAALGEVVLLTQPTRLRDLADEGSLWEAHRLQLIPTVGPHGSGLAVALEF